MTTRNFTPIERRDLDRAFRRLFFDHGFGEAIGPPLVDILDVAATVARCCRCVATAEDRDAIVERDEGMRVYVQSLSREYVFLGGAWIQSSHRYDLDSIGPPVTIHVETTGNDVTGDGSAERPYATMARASQDFQRVLRPIIIQLGAGSFGTKTSGYSPNLDLGGKSFGGRNWNDFSYPPIQNSPAVVVRGTAASEEALGAAVSATGVATDPTVVQLQFSAPPSTPFVTGEMFLQDSSGDYYPVVSISGTTVTIIAMTAYGVGHMAGDTYKLLRLGTRLKGAFFRSPHWAAFVQLVFLDPTQTRFDGPITIDACALTGANNTDDFGQLTLFGGAYLGNSHVNAVGDSSSTAENVYVYDGCGVGFLNVTAAAEFFFEGSVSWYYVRHPIPIATKFYFRACIVQEITNWGFFFDGAGTAIKCESSTYIKRGKYSIGSGLTRIYDIIDTSLKFEAGTNIASVVPEGGVAALRTLSRISGAANFSVMTTSPTPNRPFLVNGGFVAFSGLPHVDTTILGRIE